jgi:hypothetical protein
LLAIRAIAARIAAIILYAAQSNGLEFTAENIRSGMSRAAFATA